MFSSTYVGTAERSLPKVSRTARKSTSNSPRRDNARNISHQAQDRLNRMGKRVEELARYSAHHGGTDDYWRRFDEMMRIEVDAQAIWSHQRRSEARQAAQS